MLESLAVGGLDDRGDEPSFSGNCEGHVAVFEDFDVVVRSLGIRLWDFHAGHRHCLYEKVVKGKFQLVILFDLLFYF